MLNRMVRRALLMVVLLAVPLAGCGGQSLEERAHDQLQDRVDGAHENFLDRRARDPDSSGTALLETLDPWHYALDSKVTDDGVALLWGVGVSLSKTEGWIERIETRVSLGACLVVFVSDKGRGGDRGIVITRPVPCPEGTEISGALGGPSDTTTDDLEGRMDDVPEPPHDPAVCFSGELCTEGGG
jgi:hypothetical protein